MPESWVPLPSQVLGLWEGHKSLSDTLKLASELAIGASWILGLLHAVKLSSIPFSVSELHTGVHLQTIHRFISLDAKAEDSKAK